MQTGITLYCNPDSIHPTIEANLDCHTVTLSNCSITQEIEGLLQFNCIQDVQPDHKEG